MCASGCTRAVGAMLADGSMGITLYHNGMLVRELAGMLGAIWEGDGDRDVRRVAVEKKIQLEAKIKAMRAMSKALDHLIATCSNEGRPLDDCPILAAFEK